MQTAKYPNGCGEQVFEEDKAEEEGKLGGMKRKNCTRGETWNSCVVVLELVELL